jgi:23S rRNA-/tRNA-specific pseudouridylate synthase
MYGGKLVYPWQLADTEPAVQEPLLGRVALHAFSLEFEHPTTEKIVQFEAPLPQDMQRLLDALGEHRRI